MSAYTDVVEMIDEIRNETELRGITKVEVANTLQAILDFSRKFTLVADFNLPDFNEYPEGGGTGTAGAVEAGNRFRILNVAPDDVDPGTIDGEYIPNGTIAEALVDSPGQDADNWRLF